jgi:hypothetical protein
MPTLDICKIRVSGPTVSNAIKDPITVPTMISPFPISTSDPNRQTSAVSAVELRIDALPQIAAILLP